MPTQIVVSPQRFVSGLTFPHWLADIATPENLAWLRRRHMAQT